MLHEPELIAGQPDIGFQAPGEVKQVVFYQPRHIISQFGKSEANHYSMDQFCPGLCMAEGAPAAVYESCRLCLADVVQERPPEYT